MSAQDLLNVLDCLGRPRVLVLGDLMLDRYTFGDARRVSQEAPVIVLRADRSESRLGGAANVANMLAALEAEVSCAGVLGEDPSGQETAQLLERSGIHGELILTDASRPTSVKQRFVGRAGSRHPSQILRVDHESQAPLSAELEDQLVERLAAAIPQHDALLISDYSKGVCTRRVLQAAIEAAQAAGVPVLIDPGPATPIDHYRGATLIKPNRLEAELATGGKITSSSSGLEIGQQLCELADTEMALVTLDSDGILLVDREGYMQNFPTHARAVYDITGAGDMVMAMVGMCLADRVDVSSAIQLGNVAAGLEVERSGVAVIYREEIRAELAATDAAIDRKIVSRQRAAHWASEYRRRGKTVVFTNGCFDLLHVGHVKLLAESAAQGDVLVVGVNSDDSVRRLKGDSRPVIGETDRAHLLAALACVEHVVIYDEDTPCELLEALRPDVLVKGGSYSPEEVVGHEIVEAYGGRIHLATMVDGVSTTNVLDSVSRGETLGTPIPQGPRSKPGKHAA